jgi:hypothetical protein
VIEINRNRAFVGGLAGALVWFLWSSVINILILTSYYEDGQVRHLLLEQPRYSYEVFVAVWVLTLAVLAQVASWFYAAVRTAWGPGPWTAIVLGMILGFAIAFPMNMVMAAWSPLPRIIPLWWMIDLWFGAVLATLVAGALYREERDEPDEPLE